MQSEHLQSCLATATREERPDTANWYQMVEIIQTVFRYGRLLMECKCHKVVLITKGNKDFIGIIIVEVLQKALLVSHQSSDHGGGTVS